MSIHLQKDIESLKKKLLSLSSLVEQNVHRSVLSMQKLNADSAREIISADHEVDLKEVEVEEDCLKVLALHQPVAVDLRFVIATLKINNDLERIGDLAVNIAERTIFLSSHKATNALFDFDTMAEKTLLMLKDALEAMIRNDLDLARRVCIVDDEIDAMNREMYNLAYKEIRKNPEQVEALVHYLSISRHLERIADYATNIAEDIIYMIEGEIVRHKPEEYEPLSV